MIEIDLPWPPSANNLFAQVGRKRVSTVAARVYRVRVLHAVLVKLGRQRALTEPVAVTVLAHQPDARRRDLSNLWKALEDALTAAGVWADDSLVHDQRMLWSTEPPKGMVRVRITPIEQKAAG